MKCGTISTYARGCRCDSCRAAQREYDQARTYRKTPAPRTLAWTLLREALLEIAPMGLTDDCPARQGRA